jgi:hypothetical protein
VGRRSAIGAESGTPVIGGSAVPTAELAEARAELANSLRAEQEEIEQAVATRVYAIADPRETIDPEYLRGLRASLAVAVEFFLAIVERGEHRCPDLPMSLLAQARMAARNGIPLETVLRRYVAGYSLLVEFALRADEGASPAARSYRWRLLRGHAAVFDRLIVAVSEEHARELAGRVRSSRHRRADRVRRLLAGEPIDVADLGYDIEGFHLGLVAANLETGRAVKALASRLDMHVLWVPMEERVWAWIGSRKRLSPGDAIHVSKSLERKLPPETSVAFGEPAEGVHGWRLTHRQALAALPMARLRQTRVVRYAEVGLLASVSNDDLIRESLSQIYLEPLSDESDRGENIRSTLRAYLAVGRNVSSTAAVLKVNRQTVTNRLRAFERKVGQTVDDCAPALQIALELDAGPDDSPPRTTAM